MSERAEDLGRRHDLREQRKRLVAECEALRDRGRRFLHPADDIAALDREAFLHNAVALHQNLAELEGIDRKIAVLNRVLGE